MGTTRTPTYRVEYHTNVDGSMVHTMCWSGRATEARLEDWRKTYNRSFQPDGCNAHLSTARGVVLHITKARLVHQRSNKVVARTQMPMFEVV